MQWTQIQFLVGEDSTCHGAAKPVGHSCYSRAHGPRQETPRQETPRQREPQSCLQEQPALTAKMQRGQRRQINEGVNMAL